MVLLQAQGICAGAVLTAADLVQNPHLRQRGFLQDYDREGTPTVGVRTYAARPFRVPGYPLTPILFVLASSAIVLNTLVTQPSRALVGIAGVLSGVPVYLLWRRRTAGRPTVAPDEA